MPLTPQASVSEEERGRALGQVVTEGAFASAATALTSGVILTALALANRELDSHTITSGVSNRSVDEAQEVALDPLAREVVRNSQRKGVVGVGADR